MTFSIVGPQCGRHDVRRGRRLEVPGRRRGRPGGGPGSARSPPRRWPTWPTGLDGLALLGARRGRAGGRSTALTGGRRRARAPPGSASSTRAGRRRVLHRRRVPALGRRRGPATGTRSRATSSPAPRSSTAMEAAWLGPDPAPPLGRPAAGRAARRRPRGRRPARPAVGRAARGHPGRRLRRRQRRPGRPARRRPPRPGAPSWSGCSTSTRCYFERARPGRLPAARRRRSPDEVAGLLAGRGPPRRRQSALERGARLVGRHREPRGAPGARPARPGRPRPPADAQRTTAATGDRLSVLAIDAGTTGVTALRRRRTTARSPRAATRSSPSTSRADGWVEHEPEEIWQATLAAVRAALGRAEAAGVAAPTCVGITNQRETVVLWDRETLGAPRRAIVWQDRRTAGPVRPAARRTGTSRGSRELTGLRLDPYFSATKLTWLATNEPHTWARVEAGRVAVGTVDSYLVARMTRGLHHVTDASNASRTLLFDLGTGALVGRAVRAVRRPVDALPEVVPVVRRGRPHRPVACSSGSTCRSRGSPATSRRRCSGRPASRRARRKCTYGTGSFILTNTGTHAGALRPRPADDRRLGAPGRRLDLRARGRGLRHRRGRAVAARRAADHRRGRARPRRSPRRVPDSGGVVFVPALTGLGAPDWDPHARGTIIGITRARRARTWSAPRWRRSPSRCATSST